MPIEIVLGSWAEWKLLFALAIALVIAMVGLALLKQ
jgi:hypothetical protein